jgi:hypothetical protein
MPNRKRDVGVPFHGPVPEGAKTITEAEAKKSAKASGEGASDAEPR